MENLCDLSENRIFELIAALEHQAYQGCLLGVFCPDWPNGECDLMRTNLAHLVEHKRARGIAIFELYGVSGLAVMPMLECPICKPLINLISYHTGVCELGLNCPIPLCTWAQRELAAGRQPELLAFEVHDWWRNDS